MAGLVNSEVVRRVTSGRDYDRPMRKGLVHQLHSWSPPRNSLILLVEAVYEGIPCAESCIMVLKKMVDDLLDCRIKLAQMQMINATRLDVFKRESITWKGDALFTRTFGCEVLDKAMVILERLLESMKTVVERMKNAAFVLGEDMRKWYRTLERHEEDMGELLKDNQRSVLQGAANDAGVLAAQADFGRALRNGGLGEFIGSAPTTDRCKGIVDLHPDAWQRLDNFVVHNLSQWIENGDGARVRRDAKDEDIEALVGAYRCRVPSCGLCYACRATYRLYYSKYKMANSQRGEELLPEAALRTRFSLMFFDGEDEGHYSRRTELLSRFRDEVNNTPDGNRGWDEEVRRCLREFRAAVDNDAGTPRLEVSPTRCLSSFVQSLVNIGVLFVQSMFDLVQSVRFFLCGVQVDPRDVAQMPLGPTS